jgi:flagellar hook-length control protein FliK
MQNSRRQETEREMTIQLRPARLGRLVIRVSQHREQSGSSAVAVQIQASSTEAQQMLMNEMSDLQSDLQSQGIDLTGLEVSVDSGRNFHQSRSQGRFFTDYQRQVQSRRGQNPSELQNAGISSTSNRTKIGTQYANSQLNLVV